MEWRPCRWEALSKDTIGIMLEGGKMAGYVWQPQRRGETRILSPGVVSGLVRRLMARERARILRRKAIDLSRYTLEKRTQRWRESK